MRRKPNGFACLFRVAVGLHLHNLAIVNRVDIGNVAFSHLAASLWPRLKMHEDNKLVPLFDGFAIVSALDLQAPGWLVAVIAVGAVGVGIYGINLRKKTLKMQMIQNSSSR